MPVMEECVPDTPVRNQVATQTSLASGSDSEESGDETYPASETIATVPLYRQLPITQAFTGTTQPFTQKMTQPTQIIERHNTQKISPAQSTPVVQVARSSPLAPPASTHPPSISRGGILSSAIAPSGTRFCPPAMATGPVKRTPIIDLCDDDGPKYLGGSSDDEDVGPNTDIKPVTFSRASRNTDREKILESPITTASVGNGFQDIIASSFYNPLENGSPGRSGKRQGDEGYRVDRTDRSAKRSRLDSSLATSQRDNAAALAQIDDYQMRIKVERMLNIFPNLSVHVCWSALVSKKGRHDLAVDYLGRLNDQRAAELTSDDELSLDRKIPPVSTAKQQIKARERIQDKWAASQKLPVQQKKPDKAILKPRKRLIKGTRTRSDSLASPVRPDAAPLPQKPVRLIRGGKSRVTSPFGSPELSLADSDSSGSDRGLISDDQGSLETRVLKFFNTCTASDLADIAGISDDLAHTLISRRPFSSLDSIRKITHEDPNLNETSTKKRRSSKRPIGDKIVDKCLDMWTGYEAVDRLVEQCEALGKPVAAEMERWGVDVFGTKSDGELELVSLDTSSSEGVHDSGIGTPSSNRSSTEESDELKGNRRKIHFIAQPTIMSESIKLKGYQIVGINWLNLLFEQKLSCILADDMGLGKTCQVIAFLAHLFEKGIKGPHLVVVPSSTLENWLREFSVFCPKLTVMPYYANQTVRAEIRQQIEDNRDDINVIITTYTVAKAKIDSAFLRSLDFCVCVYDEGHMLKSSKSVLYEKLIRIPAQFRLLLTGTPLQNNLQELASLLGFILPSVFNEQKDDLEYIFSNKATTVDDTHSTLLSAQRIARAKSMLTPFVLRRKKHQVIDLPPKITRLEYCEMNPTQREIYEHEVESVRQLIADRAAGRKAGNKSTNILMKLRQAAIHPLFYRRIYDDITLSRMSKACLKEEQWALSDPDQIYAELCAYNDFECHTLCVNNPDSLSKFALKKDEWMMSGKVDKLCELLKRFKENGDRTLVFSQFTMVMDILEHVLETLQISFFRLDGATSVEDRQSILDAFHERVDIPVFLLSTKAGGAGINLACANKVIIFDSSFNPQEDIQAENRAHRVGQTREVEVVRLVTKDTIEEQMYALGQTKLALDQRVSGEDDGGIANAKKREEEGLKVVEEMMITKLEKEEHKGQDVESFEAYQQQPVSLNPDPSSDLPVELPVVGIPT